MNFSALSKDFLQKHGFSEQEYEKLQDFIKIVLKWNTRINLVSRAPSNNDLWEHIWDCLQLLPYLNNAGNIIDIGSGAGFPSLILSICGIKNITSVECITKKAMFQQEVANHFKLKHFTIINDKIENVKNIKIDMVVSRATFSACDLIKSCQQFIPCKPKILLLKTKKQIIEVEELKQNYNFELKIHENSYKQNKVVYEIYDLRERK